MLFAATCLLNQVGATVVAQTNARPTKTSVSTSASVRVELINNQPFPLRMPMRVPAPRLTEGAWRTNESAPVQREGDAATFIVNVPASGTKSLRIEPRGAGGTKARALEVRPAADGVEVFHGGRSAGRLSWDVIVRTDLAPPQAARRAAERRPSSTPTSAAANSLPPQMIVDPARRFDLLPLSFRKETSGVVFDVWRAEGLKNGIKLRIDLHAYHDGFLDIDAQAENVAAPTTNVYAAVVCRWQQPPNVSRSINYNNEVTRFGDGALTPFRGIDDSGSGDVRHLFIQRGVDWINHDFGGTGALWLNDFARSFTVHQDATDRRPGRWTGANSPQLTREARTAGGNLYAITELAHSNTRYYLERFVPNVLPPPGEPLAFASRIIFDRAPVTDRRADEEFIAYTGYATQNFDAKSGAARVEVGVPGVRFGTNYFPFSTLGENFTILKLPGMDRAAYWPLAADTVKQWRLFADDIRRDLRIAKAMGFERIRLHHLELIAPLDEKVKTEYLDFFFGELRNLRLKALLDAQMKPEEIAALVGRYRDALSGVEIENEVLIFGIGDGREKYWNAIYDAVKRIDPNMPVHLTGHTNAGSFDRLARLGGKTDRIGQHAYLDSLGAIPSARGFSLAAANYGRKVGKPSVITEWNWRGLTRMTPEARAKVYAPIFENVLRTRSVGEIYQFQFTESLAMDPLTLKGIRHYEPIWLSRRPKPEAFELMRLIREYSLPTNAVRAIDIEHAIAELDAAGRGTIDFRITNRTTRPLTLRLTPDAPANIDARIANGRERISVAPNATVSVPVTLAARATQGSADVKPLPGFYHVFLRLEGGDDLLRYGWAEARLAGAPPIDIAPDAVPNSEVRYGADALAFDLNRPLAVVYGDRAPILDVETASALVNTLESATGRPARMYHLPDLPEADERSGALVIVGTAKTNRLVAEAIKELPADVTNAKRFVARHGGRLVIGGQTPEDAERAAMDFIIRYWKFAKDAAARRVPLVVKDVPQGGDPALLP